jgi:hypothetical protein
MRDSDQAHVFILGSGTMAGFQINVSAQGFVSTTHTIVSSEIGTDIIIMLQPVTITRVRVVDVAGNPIPGASVTGSGAMSDPSETNWFILGSGVQAGFQIIASADGFRTITHTITAGQIGTSFTVTLQAQTPPGGGGTGGGGTGGGGGGAAIVRVPTGPTPPARPPAMPPVPPLPIPPSIGQPPTGPDLGVTPPGVDRPVAQIRLTTERIAYIQGFPDGTFRPNIGLTRAEVASMIFALLISDYKMLPVEGTHIDVLDGAWYAQAINYLTQAGVLFGYGDGTFRPNQIISRAEITALMARIFGIYANGFAMFNDVSGHWASDYISAANEYGMVQGRPDGSFDPNNGVTRAEGVALFERAFGRTPDVWEVNAELGGVFIFTDLTSDHWAFYYIMSSALGQMN